MELSRESCVFIKYGAQKPRQFLRSGESQSKRLLDFDGLKCKICDVESCNRQLGFMYRIALSALNVWKRWTGRHLQPGSPHGESVNAFS